MNEYADSVLDALGITQGPSHMEVMWCEDGVCLVEVGSRCHGGEGTWIPIAQECVGYTQVSVTIDMYIGGHLFDDIPKDIYKVKKVIRLSAIDVSYVQMNATLTMYVVRS